MNAFIDYLNSLNSASGDNENAIAENSKNDTHKFYDKLQVKTDLTNRICDEIQDKTPIIYFLTGHAGDGKTSILIQVLKELGKYDCDQGLSVSDTIKLNNDRNLFYIKDISEIEANKQLELLKLSV